MLGIPSVRRYSIAMAHHPNPRDCEILLLILSKDKLRLSRCEDQNGGTAVISRTLKSSSSGLRVKRTRALTRALMDKC